MKSREICNQSPARWKKPVNARTQRWRGGKREWGAAMARRLHTLTSTHAHSPTCSSPFCCPTTHTYRRPPNALQHLQAMRNQQQEQHQKQLPPPLLLRPRATLVCSLLLLALSAALLFNDAADAAATVCSDSAQPPMTCNQSIEIGFPFLTADACGQNPSDFIVSNCSSPVWAAFTKEATRPQNRTTILNMESTILNLSSDRLSKFKETCPLGSDNSKPTGPTADACHGHVNLTWNTNLSAQPNSCRMRLSLEQISEYIPASIDLQNFAHSAFNFDPDNVILLFGCVGNSSVYTNNTTACSSYRNNCKISDCYQYRIEELSNKTLALPEVMKNASCKQAMFFVARNSSLPPSTWTPGIIRLNWSASGEDWIARTIHKCSECKYGNGSCGYGTGGEFQCFCGNLPSNSTNCTVTLSPPPADIQQTHAADIQQPHHDDKSSFHKKIYSGIGGAVAMSLLISLALLALFFFHKRKKARMKATVPYGDHSTYRSWMKRPSFLSRKQDSDLLEISYKELVCATNTFADKNILGDGGFGAVYKGVLANGCKVAVKRLHHDNYRRMEQFYNEIKVLSDLEHQNLVKLFGFCACEDQRELLLVFEYASHGTVWDHLHRKLKPPLSWSLRLNIACETADALSYLHNAITPPIYHRDVKTTNILLDDGLHAKLADFGLSKLVPVRSTHISTAPQGTPGYLDPEYHHCYQLTDKSDVYSLGVVLMELCSGKLAVDMSRERGQINLSALAVIKIQCGLLEELIDPSLTMKKDPSVERSINRVAELAFQCLHECRDDRPTMRAVAETLTHIRREYEDALLCRGHKDCSAETKDLSSPSSILFSSGSSCRSSNLSSG